MTHGPVNEFNRETAKRKDDHKLENQFVRRRFNQTATWTEQINQKK
jgi:hypothetical protein